MTKKQFIVTYCIPDDVPVNEVLNRVGQDFVRNSIGYVVYGTVANREVPGINSITVTTQEVFTD